MKTLPSGLLSLLCAAFVLLPASADAAGVVTGVVINGFTGQPVVGANLAIEGTDLTIATGLGGAFQGEVDAGTYSVVITKDGFEPQRVTDVVVEDGGAADFAVVLLPVTGGAAAAAAESGDTAAAGAEGDTGTTAVVDSETGEISSDAAFVGEITVVAEAEASTEAALLTERKNAAQISDSIGTEEMKKSTGSDAADVVKRVTGISLQNDKYVYVRGLGERYSNTALNGSKIPSTEFEKKVVPFDLFPAGLLEKIRVSKSYTVDKPGDFAAGFVEMETKDFPVQQTASVGFSLGHHSIATGSEFARYGSGLSWSGNGGQPLPGSIPNERLIRRAPGSPGFSSSELQQFGLDFVGAWRGLAGVNGTPWGGESYSAPIDTGYNLSYGNTFGRFGLVLAGTYLAENRATEEQRNFYRVAANNPNGIAVLHRFDLDYNTESVKRGLVANFAYRITDNHHLKFRSLMNTLSQGRTKYQDGYFDDIGSDVREYEVSYKNQEVETFQLSGEHFLSVGSLGSLLEWRGSMSTADTGQDLRFSLYEGGESGYVLTDNSSSGFMFFNQLEDKVDDVGVDWTTFFSGAKAFGSVKVGLATTASDREFLGRRIRYKHRDTRGIDLTLPPEELFDDPYIRPDGFEIEETTRATDSYVADQQVDGAYAQLDWSLNKWRVIGGVRYEASDINVQSQDIFNPDAPSVTVDLEDKDWLPSLSVVYRLNQKQNLRFSASQTVNRPEFRELAPFKFSDAVGFFERRGNPDLVSATIRSYDARWEWFPSSSDVIAFSLFSKEFDDPIETVIVEAVTRAETWVNAEGADNRGLEVELRRTLNPEARNLFTLILNYSYIDSEISIPEGGIQTNPQRRMVGQPDQVGNFVIEWLQPTWRSSVRLLYNYTGERVAFAGANGLPDVLEEPYGRLDLAFRQQLRVLGLDWTFKLSGENLTDEEWEFTQGGELFHGWKPGVKWGLSVGLTFF
jgi:outer membrane receptor protein involved in Fe transport